MKLLKKMSHKELNNTKPAEVRALVDDSKEPVFICRVIGLVRGQETVDTPHGVSIKFKGDFKGWGRDKEVALAPVAYFPAPFDALLSQQINDLKGDDGSKNVTVEFGLDLFAVADSGAVGYKFIVKPLIEVVASDPMKALEASFAPLQLDAPAKQAAIGHEGAEVAADAVTTEEPEGSKKGGGKSGK